MTRTRVRRRRTALVASVALMGGIWAGPIAHAGADAQPVASHRYVVRPGDTVWGIAQRFSDGADPRALSDAIASANDVDGGAIRPGQTLVVPSA